MGGFPVSADSWRHVSHCCRSWAEFIISFAGAVFATTGCYAALTKHQPDDGRPKKLLKVAIVKGAGDGSERMDWALSESGYEGTLKQGGYMNKGAFAKRSKACVAASVILPNHDYYEPLERSKVWDEEADTVQLYGLSLVLLGLTATAMVLDLLKQTPGLGCYRKR